MLSNVPIEPEVKCKERMLILWKKSRNTRGRTTTVLLSSLPNHETSPDLAKVIIYFTLLWNKCQTRNFTVKIICNWIRSNVRFKCDSIFPSLRGGIRLRRWYITIPSSDQWYITIENHRYQWLPYPKTIGKPLIPMVALYHSIQWWW